MKTSNRILLATLVLTLLILTAIHIALFARFKSGNVTIVKSSSRAGFEEHVLNNVHYVLVDGLDNVSVAPSDSLSLGLRKADANRVSYEVAGDTLRVQLDTAEKTSVQHDYLPVLLNIPSSIPVEARFSAINLAGTSDSAKASSNTFILNQSVLSVNGQQETHKQYWKQLSITASNESNINLGRLFIIDSSDIQLNNSTFDDNRATFQKLTITATHDSKLTFSPLNLKKATITIKP